MNRDERIAIPPAAAHAPAEVAIQRARRSLSGLLDASALSRGGRYALEGRGRIVSERANGTRVDLESVCRGSAPVPYAQQVYLSFDESGALDLVEGDCSCPMQADCKHVACIALLWVSARGNAAGTARSAAAPPKEETPQPVSIAGEAQSWLRGFEAALTRPRAVAPGTECLVYALIEEGRTLELLKARVLKDGRMSVLRNSSPDLGWLRHGREAPRYLTILDIPVCRALARLSDSNEWQSGWRLVGEAGREALERSLATGRLRSFDEAEWQGSRPEMHRDADHWLRRGEPVMASLYLGSGTLGLRWRVQAADREGIVAIPVSPPMYLDRRRREIGDLKTGEQEGLAAQLLLMPEVPTSDAEVFFSALGEVARAQGMEAVSRLIPAELVLKREPPVARVRFTRGVFRDFRAGRKPDATHWVAELWFDYPQGLSLAEEERHADAMRWRDSGGGERVLLRDAQAEAHTRRKLTGAGFPARGATGYGPYYRMDSRRTYMMPGDGSAKAWEHEAPRLYEVAHAAGATIDCDAEFPLRLREVEDVYEELSATETPQWFDLELGVTVEGVHVPIAAALADWIVRTPRPQEWLERAGADTFVLLNAGTAGLVRIPAARLKQLLTPLLDTFGFERNLTDGKLRLSRLEAALTAANASRARGAADVARLRDRLKDFRGVASAAPAASFRARLRAYQQTGLDWLQFLREYGLAGILADDMGLGKTVQALAHLDLEKASGRADRPSLVVAPTSVLPNWREEAERFAPSLRVLTLHGARRAEQRANIAGADLVLTTYPLLARDFESLAAHQYHLLIFDEAQFLKNARTQARAAAVALHARHRIALTGTPIENSLAELWSHFDLLLPGFLGDAKQFARAWRAPIEREGDAARMGRLAQRVRPFILRRTRSEVLDDLPEKTEIVRHVELDGAQRDLYESLRMALDRKLRQAIGARGIAGSQIVILDALLKLRQACCDPRLVKAPAAKAAHGVSAKLEALREMLAELRSEGKRVLLFSQFTSMLDLIEPELAALGARHVRLDGSTLDRETPVKRFQAGEADVFLISLRAGGTGLNLTAADTVIHYDPWWNPAVEAQATARAHRIGQDKAVFVYKLIALGTVEERIQELLARKQALADALLGEGRAGSALISEDDIRNLLGPIDAAL